MDPEVEENKPSFGRPWDPRAALALLGVLGSIIIQGYLTIQGNGEQMPEWLVVLVGSMVAYYFGAKNGTGYKK